MTWNDPPPVTGADASPLAHDPEVILRGLKQRGFRLDGLAAEKLRLRLKLCVRQGMLSQRQSVILQEHLLGQ